MGQKPGLSTAESEAALRRYYTTVKALASKRNTHPSLPLELILRICNLADFTNPWPNGPLYTEVHNDRSVIGEPMTLLLELGASIETRPWLCTPPLSIKQLRDARRMEPCIHPAEPVMSRTHAFRPDELVIRIVKDRVSCQYRSDSEGNELSWRHLTTRTNTGGEGTPAVRILDDSHEIWHWLKPGDCIEVALEVAGWYFPNVKSEWGASIRVYTLWEPSEPMLNLIYAGSK